MRMKSTQTLCPFPYGYGCTTRYRTRLPQYVLFKLITTIILFLAVSKSSVAQQSFFCSNCNANDVNVLGVTLVQLNPDYASDNSQPQYINLPSTCTGSQTFNGVLKFKIDQNANTRYGLRVAGDIYIDGEYSTSFMFCDPREFTKDQTVEVYVPNISWTCGTKLEIKSAFIGWGINSTYIDPNDDHYLCNLTCDNFPHCKQYQISESFTVITPLSADFTYSGSCPSGNTAQRITFDALGSGGTTGGTPNPGYTGYSWEIRDQADNLIATLFGSNPYYDFTVAGTYNVKLVVTDDNPSVTSSKTNPVAVESCCVSPSTSDDPDNVTACAGQATSFTAAATGGNPTPSVKWQYRANSGDSWIDVPNSSPYSTVTTTTLNISDVTGLNGYQYRAVFTSGSCTPANTDAATLTVNTAPTISADPESVQKCTGASASFTVSYNGGSPAPSFQWQIKNGASWDNLTNTSPYSNVTTQTLNISDVTGLDGKQYRVVLTSGACTAVNSAAATLTVDAATVGGTAAVTTSPICSGSSITVSLSGNIGSIVKWQYSTGGSWTDINSTDNPLNTSALTATTTFRAVVQSGACSSANSSEATVTVDPASVGGTAGSPQTICNGSQPDNDLTVSGITGTVVKWQYSTDATFTTPVDIASSNSTTLSKTKIGTLTANRWFRAVVQSGVCSVDYSTSVKITVNQLPSIPDVTINVDYSDPISASAGTVTVTDDGAGSALSIVASWPKWKKEGDAGYTAGLPTGITLTAGTTGANSQDWVVGAGTGVTLAPGTYYIQIKVYDQLCSSTKDIALVVAPEKACGSFTGNILFINTNTQGVIPSNTTIPLKLVVSQDPDNSLGDLTKATVTFTVTGDNPNYYYQVAASNPTDNGDGTYTFSASFNPFVNGNPKLSAFGGTTLSAILSVDWSFGNYFTEGDCDDQALITISYPADDFTTGGGYIWNTNSKEILGRKGSGDSKKNNFGFNVKWNKNQTNLQGVFTTIIRKDGKLYQVKSNKPTYITTEKLSGTYTKGGKTFYKYKSTIVYSNAVIKELKGSNCTLIPNCSVGNGTVNLIVYDNGEPGSTSGATNDQIGFTVRDGANLVYYATDAFSSTNPNKYFTTTQTDLAGGNIQVHVGAGSGVAAQSTTRDIQSQTQAPAFELRATPNPTRSYFTVQLPNAINSAVNVRVMDVLGRVVETKQNQAAGQTLRIGSGYKPGVYIVEVTQAGIVKQLKLIKQ